MYVLTKLPLFAGLCGIVVLAACTDGSAVAPVPVIMHPSADTWAPTSMLKSWTSSGAAYATFDLDADRSVNVSATRYFTTTGDPAGGSYAAVGLGTCLTRDEDGNCLFGSGFTCYPEGAAYASLLLPNEDDFEIDFHSLNAARLKGTFICIDTAATRITVSVSWVGSGRHAVFDHGTQKYRESVVASGAFTIAGAEYSFGPTPQEQISLVFQVYADRQ